jgi:uncharacterized protein YjdB
VALTLDALTGDVDLEVTLGRVTVAVSPPSASLTVGATLSLAATITDEHGDPVASALPDWATTHPAVATVDAAGLVTAVAPGQTTLAATFGGAAGHTLVTVTAEP